MLKKSPENTDGRTDGQTDISQYEQTHNMMQVWTGKLSELQLPVQNPAREGACTDGQRDGHCHGIIRPFFKQVYKKSEW